MFRPDSKPKARPRARTPNRCSRCSRPCRSRTSSRRTWPTSGCSWPATTAATSPGSTSGSTPGHCSSGPTDLGDSESTVTGGAGSRAGLPGRARRRSPLATAVCCRRTRPQRDHADDHRHRGMRGQIRLAGMHSAQLHALGADLAEHPERPPDVGDSRVGDLLVAEASDATSVSSSPRVRRERRRAVRRNAAPVPPRRSPRGRRPATSSRTRRRSW